MVIAHAVVYRADRQMAVPWLCRMELIFMRHSRRGAHPTLTAGSLLDCRRFRYTVPPMDMQHGMLSSMATAPTRDLVTEADIEHDERLEIVHGEIVRKASPSILHGRVLLAIGAAVAASYEGSAGASAGRPGGWVFANEVTIELGPEDVYRPDVAGWRVEHVPEAILETPVRITPDWICEVLSPSTANRDVGHKLWAYHRARVAHYWLAHPHPSRQLLQV
ncbi:MAG TPA: Uma2 family endonuclease, partial [Haliangium sp.]|nr:Uma2 family endonuclease [Haliangium sp.]